MQTCARHSLGCLILTLTVWLGAAVGDVWAQGGGGPKTGGKGPGGKTSGPPTIPVPPTVGPNTGQAPRLEGRPDRDEHLTPDVLPHLPRSAWAQWWALHQVAYLSPQKLDRIDAPAFLVDPERRAKGFESFRADVVDALTSHLDASDDALRGQALLALAHVGALGEQALDRGFQDRDAAVRELALLAAACLPGHPARYHLMTTAAGERTRLTHAATHSEARRLRERAALALALTDGPALLRFVRETIEDPLAPTGHRCSLLGSLGLQGDPDAREALETWLTAASLDTELRCAAAEALGRLGDPESAEPLARVLTRRGTPSELRAACVIGLGGTADLDDHRSLAVLERAASSDRSNHVKQMARLALGHAGSLSAELLLSRMLQRDRGQLRAFAALGLGVLAHRGRDTAVGALLRMHGLIRSEDERRAWLAALGLTGDDRAVELLDEAARTASSPAERATACEALALHHAPSLRATLVDTLEDDHAPEVAAAAARALAHRDPLATVTLHRQLVDVSSAQRRVPLLEALGTTHDPQAIPLLLDELERTSATTSERRAALRALGQVYRPHAVSLTAAVGLGSDVMRETPQRTAERLWDR